MKQNSKIKNERGSSLLMATVMIVGIGLVGLQFVDTSSQETSSGMSDVLGQMASSGVQSGIEASLYDLENGLDPSKTYTLGESTVTISTDPDSGAVLVTSLVDNGLLGQVKRTGQINADFSKNNLNIEFSAATLDGPILKGLALDKTTEKTDILDKIVVTLDESDCSRNVSCDDAPNRHCNENDANRGHGNDCDGYDEDNPGNSQGSNGNGHDSQDVYVCAEIDLSEDSREDLNGCSSDDGHKAIKRVRFNGEDIYSNVSQGDSQAIQLHSGETIEVSNVALSAISQISIDEIEFDSDLKDGTWFTVRLVFADNSYVENRFQAFVTSSAQQVVTEIPITEGENGDFNEDAGQVVLSDNDNYVLTAQVIASEITCGVSGPKVPVTMEIAKNGVYSSVFNGKAVDSGDSVTLENLLTQNSYKIRAKASSKKCANFSRTLESTNQSFVYSLLAGASVPNTWAGFGGQRSVSQLLSSYVNAQGKINILPNQVIMLFELGTTTANSLASDYQDLVVLITVDRMP